MALLPTIENVGKIGVLIDCQGFYLTSTRTFHARELAVYVPGWSAISAVTSIDPELPPLKEIFWKDRVTINYVKKKVHGLSPHLIDGEQAFPNSKLPHFIKAIELLFTDAIHPYIGINNTHLGKLMQKSGIQYVDLQGVVPKMDNTFHPCPRHDVTENSTQIICAHTKVSRLNEFIYNTVMCVERMKLEDSRKSYIKH